MRLRFLLPLLFSVALHGQTQTTYSTSHIWPQGEGRVLHGSDLLTRGISPMTQPPFARIPEAPTEIKVNRDDVRAFLLDALSPMAQAATPAAPTQTWFPVAHENDSISIPAGTVTQYGAKAGTPWGCGTQIKPLLADAWVTPKTLGSAVTSAGLGVADPAFCYVKELDVAETATVQVVTVNGKTVTVPALPVVTPPVTKQSYILSSDTAKPLVLTINSDGTWTLSGGGKAVKQ